jgi:hypothetical protein
MDCGVDLCEAARLGMEMGPGARSLPPGVTLFDHRFVDRSP